MRLHSLASCLTFCVPLQFQAALEEPRGMVEKSEFPFEALEGTMAQAMSSVLVHLIMGLLFLIHTGLD